MEDSVLDKDAVPFTPKGFATLGINPPPSSASLHRWRLRGLRGEVLETFLRGGRRFTTRAAVASFFQRVTAATDGTRAPKQTAAARRREVDDAERELKRNGM